MVNKIKNHILNKYYTYVPGEFLPIYSGNDLINKKEFALYKAKRAGKRIARRLSYALQASRA